MARTNNISASLLDIYLKMGQDPHQLLKNYALDFVLAKIQKYQAEINKLESIYHGSFTSIKKNADKMKNEENFRLEEDLMDWEFAIGNLNYWKQTLENLKSA